MYPLYRAGFDPAKHPRGNAKNKGEFGSGGGGGKGKSSAPAAKPKPGAPAAADSREARVARAKAAHVVVDAPTQRYAEEHNEAQASKKLGGVSFPDGEAVDIAIPADPANLEHWRKTTDAHRSALDAYNAGGKKGVRPKHGDMVGAVKHGIELKTITVSKKADADLQISMKGDARARKSAWERKNKTHVHTLVLDDRKVLNAFGPGKHDESQRVMYYAHGFGNFKVQAMHKINGGWDEVKQLLATPYGKLPPAAKKRP